MSSNFGEKTTAMEVVEGINLRGKEVIVTGASAGIGVETARALAKAGARVIIGARNLEKAEAVAKNIRDSTKNPNVEVEKLELDSLASINEFVKRYLEKKRLLHILINNAGVRALTKSYTVDDFEINFGTNHVGHFALTIGLIPALIEGYKQSGKKSRVVNLSSMAHAFSDIVFDDINYKNREWYPLSAYGQSKTANILFSVALTHFYSDKGIVSNALMPGVIQTDMNNDIPHERIKSSVKYKTIEQGASTSVWAAVAPELDGVGGKYLEDCQFSKLSTSELILKEYYGYTDYVMNLESALKLWNLSTEWIKPK